MEMKCESCWAVKIRSRVPLQNDVLPERRVDSLACLRFRGFAEAFRNSTHLIVGSLRKHSVWTCGLTRVTRDAIG